VVSLERPARRAQGSRLRADRLDALVAVVEQLLAAEHLGVAAQRGLVAGDADHAGAAEALGLHGAHVVVVGDGEEVQAALPGLLEALLNRRARPRLGVLVGGPSISGQYGSGEKHVWMCRSPASHVRSGADDSTHTGEE
jgi:hypothetical protein